MSDFPYIPPTSVVTLSGTNKAAAFTTNTSEVFKEKHNISPVFISDKMQYIPWVPTTRCLITSLISSSPTKHSPPARCSTPKSATAAVLSTTQTKPPHKFIKKLMTSSPTTTSPPISAHPTKSVAWLTKNTNDI